MCSVCLSVSGQMACDYSLQGVIKNKETGEILYGVAVYIKENAKGSNSDTKGFYQIQQICGGNYTITYSLLGFKSQTLFVSVESSKFIADISMEPENQHLDEIQITAQRSESHQVMQSQTDLSGKELAEQQGNSLGEMLKTLPGVSSLQTGPSISKPVIHGLHSNRILILNNGIRQEGQQWGSEHAPEIDPFVANRISVIKGAAAVRFGADAIGGVILVEPSPLPYHSALSGEVNLSEFSNNWQSTGSGILQGSIHKIPELAWRIQGTIKQAGTSATPDYYLTNSQFQERNFSLSAGYRKKNWGGEIFFSRFTTKTGIFSGAHIGNVTDLVAAFNSPRPLVASEFSFQIGKPFQDIAHNLLKAKAFYQNEKLGKFSLIAGSQYNERNEFDLHKAYNDSIASLNVPAISFKLHTYTYEFLFEHKPLAKYITGTMGISSIYQSNSIGGRAYLIPAFVNNGIGIFLIERLAKGRWEAEAGIRYDTRKLDIYKRSPQNRSLFLIPDYKYNAINSSLSAGYQITQNISLNLNAATAWRPPNASELYSRGVHHGAAAFEQGDSTLHTEKSYSLNTSLQFRLGRLSGEMGGYLNKINGYIYLKPDSLPVLTIRGAFPGFTYTQTDALFTGIDLQLKYQITQNITWQGKGTIVRAKNLQMNEWLPYIPADRLENNIRYEKPKAGKISEIYVQVGVNNVSRQRRTPDVRMITYEEGGEQKIVFAGDFLPPPAGYMLWNAETGFSCMIGNQKTDFSVSVTNLTNVRYRDYLNRFRYFSDEAGINCMLRIKARF